MKARVNVDTNDVVLVMIRRQRQRGKDGGFDGEGNFGHGGRGR